MTQTSGTTVNDSKASKERISNQQLQILREQLRPYPSESVVSECLLELIESRTEVERLRAALEMINMLACYASEEDTDSREKVLLQIGKLARGEVSPEIPESQFETNRND